jgi:hypothetical protein
VIAAGLEALSHPVAELHLLPGNPRRGDVDAVARSLERFGQRKPIVARRDGTVVAGNHTLQAVQRLGWPEIAVVWVDDDDATAKAFALADNRTAELGGYDDEALAAMVAEVGAVDMELLGAAGYSEADLEALLGHASAPPPALSDPDDVPDPPADPVSVLGDLWLLGPHRLLCGDATDVMAHDRLLDGVRPAMLLMDPPYGMRLDTDYSTMKGSLGSIGRSNGTRGNKYAPVIGDHEDYDPQPILGLFQDVAEQFWWGSDYYAERIPSRTDGSWLVWDKRKESQADAIGAEFELCWSRRKHKRRMLRHEWFGFLSSESPTEARNRVHPTQKPVALYADILQQWGSAGGLVLDLYGGSGTTVLACYQAGMTAAVMELSPPYVDVICRRFQEHTGTKPERVLEDGTTEPHDFTGS